MSAAELQELLARAQALEPQARYDAALADLETVLARAAAEDLDDFQASALYHKGRILRIKGDLDGATACARQAAAVFARLQDLTGQAQALLLLGEVLSDQARLAEFEEVCREALGISRRSGNSSVEARSLMLLGTARILQGDAVVAAARIAEAVEIYRTVGDRRGLATSLLMLGRVEHMDGKLTTAAATVESAVAVFEELGEQRALTAGCFHLGQIDFERGALDDAGNFAERGLALTDGVGDVPMRLRCLLLTAQIEIEQRHYGDALLRLGEAERLSVSHQIQSILPEVYRTMAQATLGRGDVDAAVRLARLGKDAVTDDDLYSQGTTRLVLALALEQGGDAGAASEFTLALASLEAAGETYEIGWGHLAFGRFLLNSGRRDEALPHLARAREAFESLEAAQKLALIDSLTP